MLEDLPADLAEAAQLAGEMGNRFAAYDWASHPLGPPRSWSPETRAIVAMALTSRFPIVLWLGEPLFLIYNDAYLPMLGKKHPAALGSAGHQVWEELWGVIGPMLDGVMASGVATWSDDLMLPIVTDGQPQERYFTFTYSPILDGAGTVAGIFCAVTETTERVLGERRLRVLNALAAELLDTDSEEGAVEATLLVCAANPADLPFVAIYLTDSSDLHPGRLSGATLPVRGIVAAACPTLPSWGELSHPAAASVVSGIPARLPGVDHLLGDAAPDRALVVPVPGPLPGHDRGSLVVGLNPRRPLDDQYLGFCERLAGQFAAALSSAGAYEHERQRAEALAQVDQAKTVFLTNVSHEFRTPLTLMLGPLEDAIAGTRDPALAARLEMVHRNGRRLLRMVNSLLDFARLEAGRSEPRLVVTDVGQRTAETVSSFAEVCQRAGIELVVDCDPARAAVDLEMWETIVLNLVSNAFKFTLVGSITVRVTRNESDEILLTVTDTGTGIPAEDLDRLFDRFYRPATTSGRSAEGSGIGLALVRGLVQLHGGTITLASEPRVGTTVAVRLPAPAGSTTLPDHAPAVGSPVDQNSFVVEALGWLNEEDVTTSRPQRRPGRPLVLIADDNADMRQQLQRILSVDYEVVAAADGQGALELARRFGPDLIVTDVMMPKLDGFGLVAALLSDADLALIPVLMLSARAGMEASGEGLLAGADDYLVKPFRSRDLLNRVAARLDAAARTRSRHDEEAVAAGRSAAHAELAAVLSAALSVKEVVEAVAASRTSTLGALSASIGIVDRSSALIRIEYAGGVGPSFASRALTVALGAPVPVAEAIRENRTVVLPDQRGLAGAYRPEVRWATPSQGGSVTVPLHGHQGSAIGCLTLVWSDSGTPDANDIGFIEETASLVGGAIERLVTAEREHRMATELQDRLLDLDRRTTAAVVSAVYQSASDALRVGGDWYTATTIDSDRIGISVGDVVGHGLPAVAAMSQLRSAVEAVALTSEDPRHVINVIERYAETLPGAMGATIGYAVVDRRSGTLRYACAGHPYPLLVRPDGTTRFLEDGRRPALGLAGLASTSPPGQVQVSPGSLLILYTDGLVERRGESLDAGLLRLADTASGLVHRPAGEAATALLHKMAPDGGFSDDVALVALRPAGSNPSSFVEIVPAQVGELGPLRQRLRLWLESLGLAEDTLNDVLLGVGEATSNAIEHGSGFDPRRRVSLEAFADEHVVSVSVSDTGRWNRDSAKDHREPHQGLGLTLIHEVAADVVTVCTGSETRVSMSYRRSPS